MTNNPHRSFLHSRETGRVLLRDGKAHTLVPKDSQRCPHCKEKITRTSLVQTPSRKKKYRYAHLFCYQKSLKETT